MAKIPAQLLEPTVNNSGANESTPEDQRTPDSTAEKVAGPIRHEGTGAYLPAEYTTAKGFTRRDR